MAIKIYSKEYVGILGKVFETQQHFLRTFGGQLQIKDGVKNSENAFSLKVSDTDVVVQNYSTDANVGFGTGTANTTRFGERREIKSVDVEVPYEAPLAIHEGIDDVTVNDISDQVLAERMALHAEAWTDQLNGVLAKALSENASETLEGDVKKVFNEASKAFTNNKVSKTVGRTAYVTADVYNALMDLGLTTSAKGSSINIDANALPKFKGFDIVELPEEYFEEGENALFAADNVGVVGAGLQVYRAIESEDFAGVAIQSAAKYGKYIPEKNKKAILKAKVTIEETPTV